MTASLKQALTQVSAILVAAATSSAVAAETSDAPNILFVFADQWRADAMGYADDPNVKTPNLDRLAEQAFNFTHAISGCPVCCPYRATMMTGRRPLSHGVFLNDVQLLDEEVTIAEVLSARGYRTGYIGKWHLDGHGRSSYIPPERRQGFEYFKALECTHNYNRSQFYEDDDSTKKQWEGYDAEAHTADAVEYLRRHAGKERPFLLMLSWGPPHNPYQTAPDRFRAMYKPEAVRLRRNVPAAQADVARQELAGYYAHCTALDECVGRLWQTLQELKFDRNTIFVFTSDHGDMLHSQGEFRKQRPWDESIRVPLLIHYPRLLGEEGKSLDGLINSEDLMPTLLGLAGVPIPASVEGKDFSRYMQGGEDPAEGATLITCPSPFGEWTRAHGGREYRGVRTQRYTYVCTLDGPWLLYDNQADPQQLDNLVDKPQHQDLQKRLDALLRRKLQETGDGFLPGGKYNEKWGHRVNENGTVRYTP